jgi:ABC-type transport system substrate-binding protein
MLLSKDYQDTVFWGAATVPDADVYLGAIFVRGGAYSANASDDFDEAYNRAARTMDPTRRLDLYKRAAEVLYEEAPAIFLHQQTNVFAANSRVTGFRPDPDEGIRVQGVRLR